MSPWDPDPEEARRWIIDVVAPTIGLSLSVYALVFGALTAEAVPLIVALLTVPAISRAPSRPNESPSSGSDSGQGSAPDSGSGST